MALPCRNTLTRPTVLHCFEYGRRKENAWGIVFSSFSTKELACNNAHIALVAAVEQVAKTLEFIHDDKVGIEVFDTEQCIFSSDTPNKLSVAMLAPGCVEMRGQLPEELRALLEPFLHV